MIKSKKMRLAGKVARMRENRNTYGNVVMKYPEVREFFEDIYIYIYILVDNIKIDFSKCMIQDGGMNLSVSG